MSNNGLPCDIATYNTAVSDLLLTHGISVETALMYT